MVAQLVSLEGVVVDRGGYGAASTQIGSSSSQCTRGSGFGGQQGFVTDAEVHGTGFLTEK